MAAQKGTDFILKVGDGATPTETFSRIAGMSETSFSLTNQVMETSNLSSGKWRTLMDGAGFSSISISGSGLFDDGAAAERIRNYSFEGSINNYQLIFENGDILAGPFRISTYERAADEDSAEAFSLTLESAGTVIFS